MTRGYSRELWMYIFVVFVRKSKTTPRDLIAQAGAIVSREELLRAVWAYDKRVFTRTVDVHICSLRQKVENDTSRPKLILTVKGEGYKFAGYKFRAGRRDT